MSRLREVAPHVQPALEPSRTPQHVMLLLWDGCCINLVAHHADTPSKGASNHHTIPQAFELGDFVDMHAVRPPDQYMVLAARREGAYEQHISSLESNKR